MTVQRIFRFLRSRKLAIILILACAGWSVVGTLLPLQPGSPEAARWAVAHPIASTLVEALGISRPFAWPPFLAVVAMLALSMATCSLDRTRWAVSRARESAGISEAVIKRLGSRPATLVEGLDMQDTRAEVKRRLESLGLRVRATPRAMEARSGRLGPLGSPVFHWGLTLLIVVIALGQLTRSEGLMGVPVGESLADVPAEYGSYSSGLLYRASTPSFEVAVTRMPRSVIRDGVDIGRLPTVRLSRGGAVLAESEVYPNHPLRWRDMMIHMSADGYVALLEFAPDGAPTSNARVYFDYAENGSLASGRIEVGSTDISSTVLVLQPVASKDVANAVRGKRYVRVDARSLEDTESATLAEGESLRLPGGVLKVRRILPYARLSVVHDWSVYPIYALFVMSMLGLAVAVLAPERRVWVLVSQGDRGVELRWIAFHQRRDPTFASLVDGSIGDLATERVTEKEAE